MPGEVAHDRTVLRVSGADRVAFLQGLVTNDMRKLAQGPIYAALLTPQGKYLADFLCVADGESILLDVKSDLAQGLAQRLSMYKLRADVRIEDAGITVSRGLGDMPAGAVRDPRHPALGWRLYGGAADCAPGEVDWDALRVAHAIPETGQELVAQESFILELGFERLHGVDHRKGCYVGQEVTARMKHKTELRKGLARVAISGDAAPGTPITSADGRDAGVLHTRSGDAALAYLRFDRAEGPMSAGTAAVTRLPDPDD
jgi:hypothetical protein